MSVQARYCTTCGTGLAEGASFCTSCGAATAAPPVQAPPPVAPPPVAPAAVPMPQPVAAAAPVTSDEPVVSVIPNARLKAGFMGVKTKPYILMLTQRRVIFVQVTSQMMKQLVADARDGAKAEGKGFMGQWGAQLTAFSAFAEGYLQMPPDAALAQTPGNFAVERSTIVKTKIKTSHADTDSGGATTDRLIIKTTEKKYVLNLGAGKQQAKKALIAAAMI